MNGEGREREREREAMVEMEGERESFEYKDARVGFERVWSELEKEIGSSNLLFPKEIIWLMGAPGSGKGTNVPFIMRERGITAEPVVISHLIDEHPETCEYKAKGWLVNDRIVLDLLLRELLKEEYENGAVVDGFPRTKAQVRFIKFFFDKMHMLRREHSTPHRHFRRPQFRVCVLYIDEKTSIERQLARGRKAREYNELLSSGGLESVYYHPVEERPTDFDPELAKKRYEVFQQHFSTLITLREHFTFTMINAMDSVEKVQNRINQEFVYQSENEIATETLDAIQKIPLVGEVKQHARQALVRRLDNYETYHHDLLNRAIDLIENEIVPSIMLHVFGGEVVIRIENPILEERMVLQIILDVITERGYHISVQQLKHFIPEKMDLETNAITCKEVPSWEFRIRFPSTRLRKFVTEDRN